VDDEGDVISTAASNAEARSLWAMAIERLTLQECQKFADLGNKSGTEDIALNLELIRNEIEGMLEVKREML
jgi:hypothetical protein